MLTQTVIQVRTEKDIIDALKTANEYNVTLRCLGSMHSADPCLCSDMTNGIVLTFDKYADKPRDMRIDAREDGSNYITVKAGTKFEDMVHFIDAKGFALHDLPGIIIQTAAGMNGPDAEGGTCPTGEKKGKLLSSSLYKLRVVVPDNRHVPVISEDKCKENYESKRKFKVSDSEIINSSPRPIPSPRPIKLKSKKLRFTSLNFKNSEPGDVLEQKDHGIHNPSMEPTPPVVGAVDIFRGHDWFEGYRLSFGYLGIISTVTYELRPKFYVKSVEFPTEQAKELNYGDVNGFQWVIDHGKDWFLEHDFARIMLWPFLMECDVWGGNMTDQKVETPGRNPWNWSPMLNWIVNILLYFASHSYWFVPVMMKMGVLRAGKKMEYNDAWYKVLPLEQGLSRTPLKHSYTEIWFPFDKFDRLMEFVKWYFVENAATSNDLYKPLMPFEIYCSPDSEDIWLGPGNRGGKGNGNVRINLIMYERDIRKREDLYGPFWSALLEEPMWNDLAKSAKFHWGKYQPQNTHVRLKNLYKPIQEQRNDVISNGNMSMFLFVRERVDPNGILMNDHYNDLLGLSYPPQQVQYEERVRASYKRATSSALWFFSLLTMAVAALVGLLMYAYPIHEMIPLWQYLWNTCVTSNFEEDRGLHGIMECIASTKDPLIQEGMQTMSNVVKSVLSLIMNAACAIAAIYFSQSSKRRYVYKSILQTATFSNMAFALTEGTTLIKMLSPSHELNQQTAPRMLLMIYQTLSWFTISAIGAITLSEISDYCSKDVFQKFEYPFKNLYKWYLRTAVWVGSATTLALFCTLAIAMQRLVMPNESVTFLEVLLMPEYRDTYALSTMLQFAPLMTVLLMHIFMGFAFTFSPTWFLSIVNFSFAYQVSMMFWSLMELSDHFYGVTQRPADVISFLMISTATLFFGSVVAVLCRISTNKYTAIQSVKETSFVGAWTSARKVSIFCWIQACAVALYAICYALIYFLTNSGKVLNILRVIILGCINFASFYVGVTRYQKYPSLYLSLLELSNVASIALYFVDTNLNIQQLFNQDMRLIQKGLMSIVIVTLVLMPFVSLFITESVYNFMYNSRYAPPVLTDPGNGYTDYGYEDSDEDEE